MNELLQLLRSNGRESVENLAKMLGQTTAEVQTQIATWEKEGVIRGYQAVINEEATEVDYVRAAIEVRITPERGDGYDRIARRIGRFPEVESVFLMSGGYDLLVFVKDDNLRNVASFVNQRLATIDGVLSTATHFTLKTYKDQGVLMQEDQHHERLQVSP
ncbi:MAG: Lrp/AsnC family transcriptional regulator [Kiritimatiellia bacterium]